MIKWFGAQWWRHSERAVPVGQLLGGSETQTDWWRHAVIYQILSWSFLDTTQTGIGDLQGIIQKLDYVQSLGVDAIWLTPIYESPMEDMGYDITDMLDIDPLFGEMGDFEKLVDIAHGYGLKVLIDGCDRNLM